MKHSANVRIWVIAAALLASFAKLNDASAEECGCAHRAACYAQLAEMRRACRDTTTDDSRKACERVADSTRARFDAMFAEGGQCSAATSRGGSSTGAAPPGGDLSQALGGFVDALQKQQQAQQQEEETQRQEAAKEARATRAAERADAEAREERELQAELERERREESARAARRQALLESLEQAFNTAAAPPATDFTEMCQTKPALVHAMIGVEGFQSECCPATTTIGGGGLKRDVLSSSSSGPTVRVEYSTAPATAYGCRAWQLTTPIKLIASNDSASKVHLNYGWHVSYSSMGSQQEPGAIAQSNLDLAASRTARCDILAHSEALCDQIGDKVGTIMRTDVVSIMTTGSQTGFGYMDVCSQPGIPGDCGAGLECHAFSAKGKRCTWVCSNGCPAPSTGCDHSVHAGVCKP